MFCLVPGLRGRQDANETIAVELNMFILFHDPKLKSLLL